jgi:hypothetical protein
VLIAENQIRDSFAMFGALEVFYNRSTIETQMLLDMQTKFSSMNVQILSFQLLDIELPTKFNQALISTQNLNLNVTTVQY